MRRMLIPLLILSAVLTVFGVLALRRGWAKVGWTGVCLGPLLAMSLFTVRMAAPNVVIAGQKATERMAVAQLRTLLWAQEQFITHAGRAGLIGEMAGARPSPLSAPVLRPTFLRTIPIPGGTAATVSGYAFRVFIVDAQGKLHTDAAPDALPPAGATHWIAYAWPEKRGISAIAAFCINGAEDILQTDNAQGYTGADLVPTIDACPRGANGRLVPGKGGDGGEWGHWRGKRTRRAKAADLTAPATAAPATAAPATAAPAPAAPATAATAPAAPAPAAPATAAPTGPRSTSTP
ncbi:MAG: hypothetical protein ACI9U2_004354 [Bradymonadia bacterium]|jgi:hypothetical protein